MANNSNNYKKILIVGLTGAGKSQTGNVLINWDANKLNKPFKVSNDADATTQSYDIKVNDQDKLIIIDTIGFGSYGDNKKEVLANMRRAINDNLINNEIHLVIFVLKGGQRIESKNIDYIESLWTQIFENRLKNDPILILTNVNDNNWFYDDANKNNAGVIRLKKLFKQRNCYHLYLPAVSNRETELTREGIIEQNQIAIDDFKDYINGLNYKRTDLSFIQTKNFEDSYIANVAGATGIVAIISLIVGAVAYLLTKK